MEWKKLGIIAGLIAIAAIYTATAQQPSGNAISPYYPMWIPWGYTPAQFTSNNTYPQYAPHIYYDWGCPMTNMMGYGGYAQRQPTMPYYGMGCC